MPPVWKNAASAARSTASSAPNPAPNQPPPRPLRPLPRKQPQPPEFTFHVSRFTAFNSFKLKNMSRRRQATKRPVQKDAKFSSTLVSRLVNTVMICGKKTVAQRIVYGAFDQ